jgi:DNA-binding HxlR family transcriptional regulator
METIKKQTPPKISFSTCTTREVLRLIGDQWTALVIYALESGTRRFSQLYSQIDGVSKKMLTQTLRDLEYNGLVQRIVYPEVPPHVEYSLTPLGRTLIEPIEALRQWAQAHLQEVEQARTEQEQTQHISVQEQVASIVQRR